MESFHCLLKMQSYWPCGPCLVMAEARRSIDCSVDDSAIRDRHALRREKFGVALFEPRHQSSARRDNPPPRQPVGDTENPTDSSRCSGEPGLGGDFAVRHDLPRAQRSNYLHNLGLKT